jgi:hypothetical protein
MKRVLVLEGLLACICVVLVTRAGAAKRRADPTVSTSMYQGSVHCETFVDADGDWRIDASHSVRAPSGRIVNTCGWSTNYPPLDIITDVDTSAWTRAGTWSCSSSVQASSGADTWSGGATASLDVPNPTCACISGDVNFAFLYGPSLMFFADPNMDFAQQTRISQWLETAYPWWNQQLAWAGSSKRLGTGNTYSVYIRDLQSIQPGVMMRFTNVETGEVRIEVDPLAFGYDDDLATTWMAHELGHALGVEHHSPCDQNSSLMAAVINIPQYGADKDAEKCWLYSEYGDLHPLCHHS